MFEQHHTTLATDEPRLFESKGVEDAHCPPVCRRHVRESWIVEYPPIKELHDVERSPDDVLILAQGEGLGNWYVGVLERMDHSMLTLHLMRRLGQELAGRFLPKNKPAVIAVNEQISRIRLAKAKLNPS